MITFSRAGEDNKSFKVTDIENTFAGFAGADYDLQVGPSYCYRPQVPPVWDPADKWPQMLTSGPKRGPFTLIRVSSRLARSCPVFCGGWIGPLLSKGMQ